MKIYCRGFNLFNQLNDRRPILKEFTPTFEFNGIDEAHFNLTHTIIYMDYNCHIYQKEGFWALRQCPIRKIVLIASNDDILIYMDNEDRIWTTELGTFESMSRKNLGVIKSKKKVEYDKLFPGDTIETIACGAKLTVVYTEEGKLCLITDDQPQILEFTHNSIFDIKCGREHCLMLDEEGNVYSFGRGSRGQLGHGKLDDEPEPLLVEALAGIRIKEIAAGGWHSCAISEEGDLYTWGWNSNGQLGIGKEEGDVGFVSALATPHVVDFCEEDLNIIKVACGSRHTIAYMGNRQLYGCGWNKYHQLTSDKQRNYFKLTHLHNFEDYSVLDIHCGPWNTAVQCD